MYTAQINHSPRTPASTSGRSSPLPSQWGTGGQRGTNRAVQGTRLKYHSAPLRQGVNTNAAPVQAARQAAARSAARALVGRMLGPAAIMYETIKLAQGIADQLNTMQVGYQAAGPAPGLVLATTRQHSSYHLGTFAGTGDGVHLRTGGYGYESITRPKAEPAPAQYTDVNPPLNLPKGTPSWGPYVRRVLGLTTRPSGSLSKIWYGRFEYWYNPSPVSVPNPWRPPVEIIDWPLPYGPVIPTIPMPLARPAPRANPRPRLKPQSRTRPEQVRDVTIDLKPRSVNIIPNATPRPPRSGREKEKKGAGIAGSAVASLVFGVWEASQDWTDWVNIVASASGAPKGLLPQQQLDWLRKNPDALLDMDVWQAISDAIGWAIDEAIGQKMGQIAKAANRGIGGAIDMSPNAGTWSPGEGYGSPGSKVSALLQSLLK